MYLAKPDPKAEASALLDTYWSDQPMPVDPVAIATLLGVQVLKGTLPENIAGVLMKRFGRDPRIVVQAGDSENRRRFTVAHELGHFVYRGATAVADEEQYEYIDERSLLARAGTDPSEIFANQFAAELLMPESVVREAARRVRNATAVLTGQFGVSQEAMSYRLRTLRLLHAMTA
jgi:Zn-dependent peptidase ImmA (M78 family)